MKNALAYVRVSTKEQAGKGLSIPAQLKAIREYAESHGFRVVGEYIDEGESAKTKDRPEFLKMMKRCQKDKTIDAIIVHKLDRLCRNLIDFAAFKVILKKQGIRLISVTENVDESPSGQFIENVIAAIAEFYSANLSEEVLKGMKEKFERGEWPVKAPIGYKNVKNGDHSYVVEDRKTSYLIKQLFRLYATGRYSLGYLAEEMAKRGLTTKNGKIYSSERIKKILRNKFYIGIMEMWGKEVKGKHKPIIDESLFNQVQRILEERKITQDKWQKRDFLLRGLVYCQSCQRRLTAEVHPRGTYYRCQPSLNHKCKEKYIPLRQLEEQVETIYEILQPSKTLIELLKLEIEEIKRNFEAKSKNEIYNLKKRIRENEDKLDVLVDNLATRTITPELFKKYSQKYENEIRNAKDRLAVLEKDYSSNFDFIDKCIILASCLAKLNKKLGFRQRKNLARALFKRIWVKDKVIKKLELNPPFDFLLKNQIKKAQSYFPILFEHRPVRGTTKDIFEHLVNSVDSEVLPLVEELFKETVKRS